MDMSRENVVARIAQQDFERARRKAIISDLRATLTRQPNWLLSFEEIRRAVPIEAQFYRGVQTVPLSRIVGSVDRYQDFDRAFLPTQRQTRPRWESIDVAALTDVILPPVQLYKVGETYFVKDGNHRVSVAKEKGAEYIDAEIIECVTPIPLTTGTDPRTLLQMAERLRFFKETGLDKLREGVNIEFTALGRYDVLLEHIAAHRWFMGIERDQPVEWTEAVLSWYDNVYTPVIEAVKSKGVMQDFPGRTLGDLYLLITDYRWHRREESGVDVSPESATLDYSELHADWTRKVLRSVRRLQDAASKPLVITARALKRAAGLSISGEGPGSRAE
jgi:hypothetical protein